MVSPTVTDSHRSGGHGYRLGYHPVAVTPSDYGGHMETPTTPQATDRLGNKLPASPTAEDIDHQADRLRRVSDAELAPEALDRLPLDDLERRRRQALSK